MDKRLIGAVAGVAIAAGILLGMSGYDAEARQNEKIGMVINTPSQSVSLRQLDDTFSEAASVGIGRSNVYLFWNIIEPERGSFDWEQSDVLMGLNEKNGNRVTLFFSVINGETLGPFPDWIGRPSLNSIGQDRLVAVLDEILSRYHIVDAVIISGATESQFRHAPESIPVYRELFSGVYEELKQRHPGVKFGNSFGLHHVINKDLGHIVSELGAGDFVAFSYSPVDNLNDITKTPREAGEDLSRVFDMAPGKKVAFFELSWSTSDFVGGDAESQRDFVGEAFEFYLEHEQEIEFMTWYRQHDRPEGTCASELRVIGDESVAVGGSSLADSDHVIERLDHYICNAGLVDVDGNPKPAWAELETRIEQTH